MRKLIGIGCGAIAAAGATMALVGHGTATAAPDVSGQTYGKAKQSLAGWGLNPIVATRVGDRVADDNCIVDRVQDANFVSGTGSAASNTVYVYLNCYGNVASTTSPGYSAQNPMGKTVEANGSQ